MKLLKLTKLSIALIVGVMVLASCAKEKQTTILMKTSKGDITLVLYDKEAPLHAANFKKLVEEGYYDGVLFHRVIKDFMIQGGDPDSKNAAPDAELGNGGPTYTVPAEFRLPDIYHKRGVLAAAREGNDVNPQKASSGSQFYITWGKVFDDAGLDKTQIRLDTTSNGTIKLTPQMRETYKTLGGVPHLDGNYTVFGEVISGLEVVDAIQQTATSPKDRPIEDIKIISAKVI